MAFSINPGVWPVMITPWTEDNKPDFKAIKQLCDWYVEKGCTGIFAVCQSSELAYLTAQAKLDIARATAAAGPRPASGPPPPRRSTGTAPGPPRRGGTAASRWWPPATPPMTRPPSSGRSRT